MQQMQEQHGNQIRNIQGIHNQELEAKDKEISRLNAILEKAFNWFPLLKEMLRMEKIVLCHRFYQGDDRLSFVQKGSYQMQWENLFRRTQTEV